jgi:hypothetical protein
MGIPYWHMIKLRLELHIRKFLPIYLALKTLETH